MTVLGENDEWPTRPMRGTDPADMRKEPKSIGELIAEPICRFVRRFGRHPTHLLLGWNAKEQLMREMQYLPMYRMPPDPTRKREYHGMTLIFMEQNGIEVFIDWEF